MGSPQNLIINANLSRAPKQMADYFEYEEGAYDYLFKVILLGDVDSRKVDFLCTYTGKGKDRSLGKSRVNY